MSKQSNQRYRKEMKQEGKSTTNVAKNSTTNETTTKNQPNRFDYGDGDFDAPSNQTKKQI